MTSTTSRSKKVLAPLAVLLAAGALAVGSGATFTSASSNTIGSVTSGTLTHSNSKDNQVILSAQALQPGKSQTGDVTLTNTGTLPASFSLTGKDAQSTFAQGDLKLKVVNEANSHIVYEGDFGGLRDGGAKQIGNFTPGQAATFKFTVTLDQNAGNTAQGQSASAAIVWDAIQINN
ncbi:hypothetical protein [Ornithinimicrobium pratense]|uniref:Uncharacterized protein n=1 Tax=Ornithinimicrobium pratense TaxID=2593973 RepID=A0A5J6V998_9MICO|nr:hypothetical protein [Ornithinimicrobium pratense]QFG69592.1 hypothetical protein FY030_13560 [Ornithinimicrobium pratense]